MQDIQYDLADHIVKNGFINNSIQYQNFKTLNKYISIDTIEYKETKFNNENNFKNEDDLIEKIRFRIKSESNKLSVYKINKKEKGSIVWENDKNSLSTTLYYKYKKAGNSNSHLYRQADL